MRKQAEQFGAEFKRRWVTKVDKYRQAITAAESGCMAAVDCQRFLESNPLSGESSTL